MAVPPCALVGSLSTSRSLSACDVISVRLAKTHAELLNFTSPTEYPVGTALRINWATVCRNLANLATWQNRIDANRTVYVNYNCV